MEQIGRTVRLVLLAIALFLAFAFSALAGPKILLFTASYGAGHDAAAKRVKEAILEKTPDAEVIIKNMQDFMPEAIRERSVKAFNWAQSKPKVYDFFFDDYIRQGQKVEHVGKMPIGKLIRMKEFITWTQSQHPDAMVATWFSAVDIVENARRQGALKDVPLGWVHTDNVSNGGKTQGYFEKAAMAADHAFMPGVKVAEEFVAAGVPQDRLTVRGMPVKLKERPPLTMEQREARKLQARTELGLDPLRKTIMIEAGKNGIGNYPAMIGSILHASPGEKLNIIAATGENPAQLEVVNWMLDGVGSDQAKASKLYSRLKVLRKQGVSEQQIQDWIRNGVSKEFVDLRPLKFVPLTTWRFAADVVATKPGGLSTAEMAADGIPMILRAGMASGQELHNVAKFVDAGLAVTNNDEATIGSAVKKVLEDRRFLETLYRNSEEFRTHMKTDLIADWTLKTAQEHALRTPASSEGLLAPVQQGNCLMRALRKLKAVFKGAVSLGQGRRTESHFAFPAFRPIMLSWDSGYGIHKEKPDGFASRRQATFHRLKRAKNIRSKSMSPFFLHTVLTAA